MNALLLVPPYLAGTARELLELLSRRTGDPRGSISVSSRREGGEQLGSREKTGTFACVRGCISTHRLFPQLVKRIHRLLVHVTPDPRFPGLEGLDQGMTGRVKMGGCVPVLRGVATTHVTANQAYPQVNPPVPHRQALFAPIGLRADILIDRPRVRAVHDWNVLRPKSRIKPEAGADADLGRGTGKKEGRHRSAGHICKPDRVDAFSGPMWTLAHQTDR
jgi:hypothetical protein